MKEGVTPLAENTTSGEKDAHKELKNNDYKALLMIHQCFGPHNFEKISNVESAKEAWEIIKTCIKDSKKQ